MDNPRAFERLGGRVAFDGRIVKVHVDEFRYSDGKTAEREIARTSDAAAVVAVDDEHVWLVRQPREAVDDPDSLELPAGRLDKDGEDALATAKRELAEEIGKQAGTWEDLGSFYTSAGFADEEVFLYLATDISDADERPAVEEDERIDAEIRPVRDIDAILAETKDAKTLIGLMKLRERLRAG
jgi:ADP-ribose pyrophosphatase